jgi:hemerythrin
MLQGLRLPLHLAAQPAGAAMSDFFEWDAAKYSLEIPKIDDEHRQIIDAMNELHVLHTGKQPKAQIAPVLRKLSNVTVAHFREEEAYMEKIGYSDLRKHRHVHKHLLDRLESYAVDFQATGVLTEDFFMFLKMWLKSHICGIDSQYAKHAHAA